MGCLGLEPEEEFKGGTINSESAHGSTHSSHTGGACPGDRDESTFSNFEYEDIVLQPFYFHGKMSPPRFEIVSLCSAG